MAWSIVPLSYFVVILKSKKPLTSLIPIYSNTVLYDALNCDVCQVPIQKTTSCKKDKAQKVQVLEQLKGLISKYGQEFF